LIQKEYIIFTVHGDLAINPRKYNALSGKTSSGKIDENFPCRKFSLTNNFTRPKFSPIKYSPKYYQCVKLLRCHKTLSTALLSI